MKKTITVLFALVFMLSLSLFSHTTVDAEAPYRTPDNSSLISYGKLCDCGGTHYLLSTSYGEPEIIRQEKCTSQNWGTDLIKEREVTKTYRCSSCSHTYEDTTKETFRECHGYQY